MKKKCQSQVLHGMSWKSCRGMPVGPKISHEICLPWGTIIGDWLQVVQDASSVGFHLLEVILTHACAANVSWIVIPWVTTSICKICKVQTSCMCHQSSLANTSMWTNNLHRTFRFKPNAPLQYMRIQKSLANTFVCTANWHRNSRANPTTPCNAMANTSMCADDLHRVFAWCPSGSHMNLCSALCSHVSCLPPPSSCECMPLHVPSCAASPIHLAIPHCWHLLSFLSMPLPIHIAMLHTLNTNQAKHMLLMLQGYCPLVKGTARSTWVPPQHYNCKPHLHCLHAVDNIPCHLNFSKMQAQETWLWAFLLQHGGQCKPYMTLQSAHEYHEQTSLQSAGANHAASTSQQSAESKAILTTIESLSVSKCWKMFFNGMPGFLRLAAKGQQVLLLHLRSHL